MHLLFPNSLRIATRTLLVSFLACLAAACSDDYPEPPRNLDGAVFVPPVLDGGKALDASVTLGIDAALAAVDGGASAR